MADKIKKNEPIKRNDEEIELKGVQDGKRNPG
jgi:hypothetical protein